MFKQGKLSYEARIFEQRAHWGQTEVWRVKVHVCCKGRADYQAGKWDEGSVCVCGKNNQGISSCQKNLKHVLVLLLFLFKVLTVIKLVSVVACMLMHILHCFP